MRRRTHLVVFVAALILMLSSSVVQSRLSAGSSQALDMSSVIIDKGLTGLTWDGKEFISSYGINNVPLINVSLDGHKITPFAPSFVGKDEVYAAISQGKAGFPTGYFYVNFDPTIYEINPTGSQMRVFSTPPGSSRVSYVAFDTVGSWGYVLFALDDNGLLWSIKSNGTAKVIGDFSNFGQGGGLKPEGIAVAPQSFGSYGGYLMICLEGAHRVLAIDPNDTSKITVLQFPGEQPERVLQIPSQSDLYVAEFDTGAMVKVPAANFSNYAGSMLVITEGETEPFGSFTVLQATGSNITTTRIGMVTGNPHFEGASFVPTAAAISSTGASTSSTGTQSASESPDVGSSPTPILIGAVVVVVIVAVVIVGALLVSRSRRSKG